MAARLPALALALVLALQPFALCCAARADGEVQTHHAGRHHENTAHQGARHGEDVAHPEGIPSLTTIAACTSGAATVPALRERSRDPSPALVDLSTVSAAAGPTSYRSVSSIPIPSHCDVSQRITPLRL